MLRIKGIGYTVLSEKAKTGVLPIIKCSFQHLIKEGVEMVLWALDQFGELFVPKIPTIELPMG